MASKKPRINRGKHIIVSDGVHSDLKMLCVRANVEVTKVADDALAIFVETVQKDKTAEEVNTILADMAKRCDARNPPIQRRPRVSVEAQTDGVDAPVEEQGRTE